MEKSYYPQYYIYERNHWWFVVRAKILTKLLTKFIYKGSKLKILNIGVATGATTEMLYPFGEVISVEYDKDCCEFLKGVLKTEVINGSITELPFEANSFDLVCAFDVIEHVEDHETAVKEMKRVCKQEGSIFVSVPTFMSLWSDHDVINQHIRRYRIGELRELFKSDDGKTIKSSYFNYFLFSPILIFRKIHNLIKGNKKTEAKSDFETTNMTGLVGKLISFFLKAIFSLELLLISFINFPVGVSAALIWRKNK